jgi:endo-1,4-beta-xylanase
LYDSTVKLYYNDYNIEYAGAKATAAQGIVSSLKARGIKIDGVGLQGHFIVGETPGLSAQISNLESFTALGVEVAYTELDVRFTSLPPTAAGLVQQGTDYVNTVLACVETTNCVGVTIWDFTDLYSWIPATFSGQGDACLWYSNFTVHPAYNSVISALGGATTVSSTTLATSTTKSTTTTTTTATTTPTGTGVPVAEYGKCGGIGYLGSTVCAAGYTCTYFNAYYSQCL